MPASINGLGTTYYGQRDRWRDGSFLATEWAIFLYLPVFPLGSVRLLRDPQDDAYAVIVSQTGYMAIKQPLCWPQVLATYAFVYGSLAWIAAMFSVAGSLTSDWQKHELVAGMLLLAACSLPAGLYFWSRSRNQTASEQTMVELINVPPPRALPPKLAVEELPRLPSGPITLHLLAGDYGLSGRLASPRLARFPRFRETACLASDLLPDNLASDLRTILESEETYQGERMRCFNPHHGLTIGQGSDTMDVLVCVKCQALCLFQGNNKKQFLPLAESAIERLSSVFSAARPDLAGLTPSQQAQHLADRLTPSTPAP